MKVYGTRWNYPQWHGAMPINGGGGDWRDWRNYGHPQHFNGSLAHWNRHPGYERMELKDYGSRPFVIDIEEATKHNRTFRTALWTGKHLQVTLMSIGAGEDIGLEIHPHLDQFLRIEEGQGLVQMGKSKDKLDFQAKVQDDFAIVIPAGTWHNLTNTGSKPLKLYSIYAPPEHPYGTVHATKAAAMAAEANHARPIR